MAATVLTRELALGAKPETSALVAVSNAATRLRLRPLTVVNSPTT
ncbi:hypothetical protein ACFDTO_04015 [Microbacteriaceae bacterium 4G12]